MSVLDSLVTDRTQAHVDRLKALMRIGWQNMTDEEKAEYLGGGLEQLRDANNQPLFDSNNEPLYSNDSGGVQKGAYNYTDLNRVEEAVDYIAASLFKRRSTFKHTRLRSMWRGTALSSFRMMTATTRASQ